MRSLILATLAISILAAPGYIAPPGKPCVDSSGRGCLGEEAAIYDLVNQMVHTYKPAITVCAQSDFRQPCTVVATKVEGCTSFYDGDLNGPGNPIKSAQTTDSYKCWLYTKAHCWGNVTFLDWNTKKADLGLWNNNVRSIKCSQNMQPKKPSKEGTKN